MSWKKKEILHMDRQTQGHKTQAQGVCCTSMRIQGLSFSSISSRQKLHIFPDMNLEPFRIWYLIKLHV